MKFAWLYLTAITLATFGLLTLFLSSSVIFDFFDIRTKEGNYVVFIVWANFICSILYLFAAWGLIRIKKWTALLLGISTFILIISFIGLLFHISTGSIYETKTVGAMIFRIAVTIGFTSVAFFALQGKTESNY